MQAMRQQSRRRAILRAAAVRGVSAVIVTAAVESMTAAAQDDPLVSGFKHPHR